MNSVVQTGNNRFAEPIVPPLDRTVLETEVAGLPAEQTLLNHDRYSVLLARAHQIPKVLCEIGRLRETSFRAVGEGTGKAVDLDRYDLYYTHLFIWDKAQREIAGAYRLGPVDMILRRFGPEGLYTNSLFHMKAGFLDRIADGIELGRSFIHPEYQRQYAPLLLLWKGIGRYVAENPRYRVLFGAVTISNSYSAVSHQLMVHFLRLNYYAPDLARLVAPRMPFRERAELDREVKKTGRTIRYIEDLSSVVAALEPDRKEVPVLLKQYIKLGGRFVGFTVDPSFSDGLGGLIFVDLKHCEKKILDRCMGEEGATYYLNNPGPTRPEQQVA